MNSHPKFQPDLSKPFFQSLSDKAVHISQFVWLAVIRAAIIYILCRLHLMTTSLMVACAATGHTTSTLTSIPNMQKDHHSTAIVILIIFWFIPRILEKASFNVLMLSVSAPSNHPPPPSVYIHHQTPNINSTSSVDFSPFNPTPACW